MEAEYMLDTLSNKDHQTALEIINRLGECQTREQLNQILKISLVPLMACSGAFYARLEGEHNSPRVLDAIYPSSLCRCRWTNFLEAATQSCLVDSSLARENVSSFATGAFCCIDRACSHGSAYPRITSENEQRCCAIMVVFDSPNPTVALYFCRFTPKTQYFSTRDIELLHLLRATVLQTVRAVIYREECQNLQHILNCLPDYAEPLAMVSEDGALVFKNHAFDQAVGQNNRASLSTFLRSITAAKSDNTGCDRSLSSLGRRLYEVSLTPVNTSGNGNPDLYFCASKGRSTKINKSSVNSTRRG